MKRRKIIWLALLVIMTLSGIVGYSVSVRQGMSKRMIVARDVSDAGGIPRCGGGYDPCFVEVNHLGNFAFSSTNAVAQNR